METSEQNGTFDVPPLEEIFGPRRDSLYIVIPMTVIYCIIFFTGLVGNISTCIVIARNKSMHTATNYYLFSLAISDLLLLISGLPQEMYSIWSRYPYVFGYTFCVLRGLCSETSANATVLTITAFTVERYVAICHPFLSHTLAKLSRIVKLILLIWIIAVCFAVPQAVQFGVMPMMEGQSESVMCHVVNPIFEHSFEVSTFLFFVAPMTLITVLYVLIGLRLRSSTNMMKKEIGDCAKNFGSRGSCVIPKMGTRHQNSKASRRVLKMLVAVVVAFFICWAPFHAQRLFAIYVTPSSDGSDDDHYLKIYEIMTYVSGILYYVSTTINPLLYNIMSNKFREAFKETFTRCCHLGRPGRTERSYSVLSRSAQRGPDSTDSGKEDPSIHTHMSLIQKNSMEAAVVSCGAGCRPHDNKRQPEKNSNDVDKIRWPKDRSDIRLSVVPKHNYENIQPGTKLVAVHVNSAPPRKFGSKFLQLFHCLAKRTLDDGKKLTTYYASPAKETHTALELERTTNKQETFSLTSGEISDSSLRDVENHALEDELNTYMLELQGCELR